LSDEEVDAVEDKTIERRRTAVVGELASKLRRPSRPAPAPPIFAMPLPPLPPPPCIPPKPRLVQVKAEVHYDDVTSEEDMFELAPSDIPET